MAVKTVCDGVPSGPPVLSKKAPSVALFFRSKLAIGSLAGRDCEFLAAGRVFADQGDARLHAALLLLRCFLAGYSGLEGGAGLE